MAETGAVVVSLAAPEPPSAGSATLVWKDVICSVNSGRKVLLSGVSGSIRCGQKPVR